MIGTQANRPPMPGAGVAPGQAQPQGLQALMANAQASGGSSMGVNNWQSAIDQLPVQQLLAEFMNPASQVPKYALIAAIDKQNKNAQAMQAVKGMAAQQAAAQQQQPVAAEVIAQAAPPVQMAAHGGMMRGYSGGGIVALQSGGPLRFANGSNEQGVQSGATSYPVLTPEELSVNERIKRAIQKLRTDARETDERSVNERIKAALPELPKRPSRTDEREKGARSWQSAAPSEEVDLLGESLIPPAEEPDIGQAPRTAMLGKTGDPDIDVGLAQLPPPAPEKRPDTEKPPAEKLPAAAAAAPSRGILNAADYNPYFKAEGERLGKAGELTPEVLAARAEYDKLYQEQRAMREAEAQQRAKGLASLEQRAKSAGGIDTDALLLALGTSLSGARTFSEGMGAAGKQLQGLKQAAAERQQKAEDALMQRQDAVARLSATDRQIELAQRELIDARATRDMTRVQDAQAKLNALALEHAKLRNDIAKSNEDLRLKGITAAAQQESARAATAQAEAAKTRAERETVPAEIKLMEWLRAPENRKLYEEIQAAKRYEDRVLKMRELYDKRPVTAAEMSFDQFVSEVNRVASKKGSTSTAPLKFNPATGKIE